MRKSILLTVVLGLILFLLCSLGEAKRGPAPEVEPIFYKGIKYIAPNTPQKMGYVEAWDIETNEKVWEKKIYTVVIDPAMESDVQWVFISSLNIEDNKLVVVDERGKEYKVDIPKGIFQDINAGNEGINLAEAQKLAKEYLNLLKQNKFEQAFNMVHIPNYNPENREIDLEAMKLLNEEFGDIIDYRFKDSEWLKPLFHYHWDPGKMPLKDEPEKIKEPAYLSLIYEIQYEAAKGNKEIQVVEDNSILKIQKVADKFSSPGAILKMMNLYKKLPKKPKDEN